MEKISDCGISILFLLLVLTATLSTAYDRKCPDPSHWQLNNRAKCLDKNYICLMYLSTANSRRYEESCDDEDKSEPGGKLVLRPFKDFAECDLHRYQPFVFTTAGNSDCVYQKSKCNEDGQVVFNNETVVRDTFCRCDYKNGYTFVIKPKNVCYCIPSEEDCSCYKPNCSEYLSGLNCYESLFLNLSTCEQTGTPVFTELPTVFDNEYEHHDNIINPGLIYRMFVARTILGIICISCTIEKPRIILMQPSGNAISGVTVKIDCKIKSKLDILEVRWQRHNSCTSLENGDKYCFKKEHDATLTINEVNLNDAGTYTCFVKNSGGSSKSKPFILTVVDLKVAKELRHYVRVIVVGKESVGKTSLLKRLLWKSPSDISNITSTDGIDISITECEINVQDGKWMPYNEATDDLVQRFERAFAKEHTKAILKDTSKILSASDHSDKIQMSPIARAPYEEFDVQTTVPNDEQLDDQCHHGKGATDKKEANNKKINPYFKAKNAQNQALLSKTIPPMEKKSWSELVLVVNENKEESPSYTNTSIDFIEKNIDDATSALINSVKDKHATITHYTKTASCWLWDFAGQKDFYATHQAFLSSCAVYLLVVDITDDISKQQNMSEGFQHAGDYIDFWLNSIHCYWSATRNNRLDPPVIVVCSKDDKLKLENQKDRHREKETNRRKFEDKLCDRFRDAKTNCHIQKIVSVSNVEDSDAIFNDLRQEIFRLAGQMKGWGRNLPLRWIFLEMILQKMKVANVNVTTYKKLDKIARNKHIGITDTNELDDFLQTQHDIGNIIYFPHDNLKDHIIVNPKWLVQAFRCLISDKIDQKIKMTKDWGELQNTGKMTDTLFCQLLKKASDYDFLENKSHLIEVLKLFDILVHPRNEGLRDNLYMPCGVKAGDLKTVLDTLEDKRTPWLCFEFDFLPPAFFNHVIVFFIKNYSVTTVWKEGKKELAIYRHFAVFDLDDTRNEQIVVFVSGSIIGIQICTSKSFLEIRTYAPDLKNTVDDFITTLKQKYKMNINHKISFKCNSETFKTDRWEYSKDSWTDIRGKQYFCSYHRIKHDVVRVLIPWYYPDFPENITDSEFRDLWV